MSLYEKMLAELGEELIIDDKAALPKAIKGFYMNKNQTGVILLNKDIDTTAERICTFMEEVGHYYTTVGDITDQSKTENRRQELKARKWAYKHIVSLRDIINAFEAGCRSKYDLAEYLEVTDEFLGQAIDYYHNKYGLMTVIDEYIIYFDPLGVLKRLL